MGQISVILACGFAVVKSRLYRISFGFESVVLKPMDTDAVDLCLNDNGTY